MGCHRIIARVFFSVTLGLILGSAAVAGGTVSDDVGTEFAVGNPVKRIISLAPHTTEMLFAAGAGDKVVGVVAYSDYPETAKKILRIGSYESFDLESILALSPDLIVGWSSGNPESQLQRLRELGFELYLTEPREFESIASNVERLGRLAGTEKIANKAAADFRSELVSLQSRYSGRQPVSIFYQIWNQPLMTINDHHLIGKVIDLCGGRNIFGKLDALAPQISIESVLKQDPEVIVVTGMGHMNKEWLDVWRRWPGMKAIAKNNAFSINPDTIQRHSPRILQGADSLCKKLDTARKRLGTGLSN